MKIKKYNNFTELKIDEIEKNNIKEAITIEDVKNRIIPLCYLHILDQIKLYFETNIKKYEYDEKEIEVILTLINELINNFRENIRLKILVTKLKKYFKSLIKRKFIISKESASFLLEYINFIRDEIINYEYFGNLIKII